MRLQYFKVVTDIETGRLLELEASPYSGEWAECKGDNSKAEMDRANALQAQQQALMQQQLQMQQQQINAVNAVEDPIIAAGGMSPQEQAALTSLAINQLPADFANTEQSVNTNLLRRGITGGNMAGSGDISRNFGQLGAMEDYMKSGMLSNIQLQKAQQLQQALGVKMGIAGMYGQNTGMFNQGSLNALGIGTQAAYNADQAQTGWLGPLLGAVGSLGSTAMKTWGCWIAFAIYGDEPEAYAIRAKLWNAALVSRFWRTVLGLYLIAGEPVAWVIRKVSPLQKLGRLFLDRFLVNDNG